MFNTHKLQAKNAVVLGLGMLVKVVSFLVFLAPTLAQSTFKDVQGNWAESCIAQLSNQGIISGYPDGSFRPNAPVTRSEFAAMVGKAFPNADRTRNAVQFVDVPSNRDALLGAAVAAGVAGVTGDRTIDAGEVIGGAATGATVGGVADRTSTKKVVVINPDADLDLRLNAGFTRS